MGTISIPMINTQKKEHIQSGEDGLSLDVIKIWPTIQGEGPLAGCPAIFIRLAGCNLECPACDTDYTVNRKMMSVEEIIAQVNTFNKTRKPPYGKGVVVLTGGEPFRQNIKPLTDRLLAEMYEVQIETNGTLYIPNLEYEYLEIVVSPKVGEVHPLLLEKSICLKYVVQAGNVSLKNGLPIHTLGNRGYCWHPDTDFYTGEIYIQPLDEVNEERNKLNMATAVEVVEKYGYRLGLQLHKIIGVE